MLRPQGGTSSARRNDGQVLHDLLITSPFQVVEVASLVRCSPLGCCAIMLSLVLITDHDSMYLSGTLVADTKNILGWLVTSHAWRDFALAKPHGYHLISHGWTVTVGQPEAHTLPTFGRD